MNPITRQVDEYRNQRQEFLKLSIEEKAQLELKRFELLYWGVTKQKEVPKEILDKVHQVNLEFYRSNPQKFCVNSLLWRDIIPNQTPKLDIFQQAVFRVIGATEVSDLEEFDFASLKAT